MILKRKRNRKSNSVLSEPKLNALTIIATLNNMIRIELQERDGSPMDFLLYILKSGSPRKYLLIYEDAYGELFAKKVSKLEIQKKYSVSMHQLKSLK